MYMYLTRLCNSCIYMYGDLLYIHVHVHVYCTCTCILYMYMPLHFSSVHVHGNDRIVKFSLIYKLYYS